MIAQAVRSLAAVSSSSRARRAGLLIAFGVWIAFVASCLRSLKAGTVNVGSFSSDSAVPVLMANGSAWNVFQTFFYGQDRFGAWPFLLLRLAKPLGVVWSWERVHVWMSIWALAGSIALAYLGRWLQPLGAVVYLIVLLLANPQIRGIMFDWRRCTPGSSPPCSWGGWH